MNWADRLLQGGAPRALDRAALRQGRAGAAGGEDRRRERHRADSARSRADPPAPHARLGTGRASALDS